MAIDDARDRDLLGRPRNARPRDGLGRPLAHGMPGVPTTPDDLVLPPVEALCEAQRLLDSGRPFHAHEVLEGVWKSAGPDEREFWRGMAQLAVGLTHARRGNTTGAARLLRRAADRIEPYAVASPHGVPVAGLVAWARDAADTVPGEVPTPTLIDGPVLKLLRWEDSGAVWRVVSRTDSEVVVSLLTCTAGEEIERVRSADPALRAYLGDRLSSELD
jgi:uncharacterized protein